MSKTQAEYQKEYRDRQKLTRDTNAPETNAPVEPLVSQASVAECQERARRGLPWRVGDHVWPYTRHLTPYAFIAWCRKHKPSWLTSAKPGDADYNWDESALPRPF